MRQDGWLDEKEEKGRVISLSPHEDSEMTGLSASQEDSSNQGPNLHLDLGPILHFVLLECDNILDSG